MAKAFSVASWNVEHLRDRQENNVARVAFLQQQRPDVVAVYEAEGKYIWQELMEGMPGYSFFITEGSNTQEILLGTAPGVTAFVTQKLQFRENNPFMRPGALMTVRVDGVDYALLFLHLASWPKAGGFGLRTDMTERAFTFKAELDRAAAEAAERDGRPAREANYIFLGDLNTMGLEYQWGSDGPGKPKKTRIPAEQEIASLGYLAEQSGMRLLTKTADASWHGSGRKHSNLDHVVASKGLRFRRFARDAEVDVRGWPQLDEADHEAWMNEFSDHALLYFEVERAG
jgi:exonuclease III